jgi:hypothetical protein
MRVRLHLSRLHIRGDSATFQQVVLSCKIYIIDMLYYNGVKVPEKIKADSAHFDSLGCGQTRPGQDDEKETYSAVRLFPSLPIFLDVEQAQCPPVSGLRMLIS